MAKELHALTQSLSRNGNLLKKSTFILLWTANNQRVSQMVIALTLGTSKSLGSDSTYLDPPAHTSNLQRDLGGIKIPLVKNCRKA